MEEEENITVEGSCHCKAITFKCTGIPRIISVYRCNCSICIMKQNHHFIVQKKDFQLLTGQDHLSTYQFNEKIAIHMFCNNCGVQAYYQPRSNPDCYAVTIYCIKDWKTIFDKIEWKDFGGRNWDEQIKTSDITKYSK